jgi:hypothetical protein
MDTTDKVQAYLDGQFQTVLGWCVPQVFLSVLACRDFQAARGLDLPVAEIGVYHGKFLIGLAYASGRLRGHKAIDVFDMQEFNLDGAGKGDVEKLKANIERSEFGLSDFELVRVDSMTLTSGAVSDIRRTTGGFSFFSVDGCHMVEHTINDIEIAMELTDPLGIILIDDYTNADWPGVQEGVAKLFFTKAMRFVPLAVSCNKLFMCHISYHTKFLDHLKGALGNRSDVRLKEVVRFGYECLTVSPNLGAPCVLRRS